VPGNGVALYFAYGSNMASHVMAGWCAEHRFVGPARLDGFRLLFLRRSVRWKAGAADVVPDDGAATWGALYEVSAADLDALDRKEFATQGGYQRREVQVVCDGDRHRAVTYEVVEKAPHELAPKQEYVDLLIRGAQERGLPPEWIDVLKELPRRFA
jgi:gamma-glutamylcyclotransferase